MNTLITSHRFVYCGREFIVRGTHTLKFARNSRLSFTVFLDGHGIRTSSAVPLRNAADRLLSDASRRAIMDAYYLSRRGLSIEAIIAHSDFGYARLSTAGAKLYLMDVFSPSGVSLAGSTDLNTWEVLSRKYGRNGQYLAGDERW